MRVSKKQLKDTLKNATNFQSSGSEVLDALTRYVDDNVPWLCSPLLGDVDKTCYVIFKPHSKIVGSEILDLVMNKSMVSNKLFNPNDEITVGMMTDLFKRVGTEFPLCSIGVIDGESRLQTGFVVHYNGSIVLDYAEPDFFDKLDLVLDYIKTHDEISGFSLPTQNAA